VVQRWGQVRNWRRIYKSRLREGLGSGSVRKSNFSAEQIRGILGELDSDTVATVAQRHALSKQTIYVWKRRFGSLEQSWRGGNSQTLKRYLGEPLGTDLEDFCTVHHGAPQINVIREAVRMFIDDELARSPELQKKFDNLRQSRIEKQSKSKSPINRSLED
jgi:hypothetical protein